MHRSRSRISWRTVVSIPLCRRPRSSEMKAIKWGSRERFSRVKTTPTQETSRRMRFRKTRQGVRNLIATPTKVRCIRHIVEDVPARTHFRPRGRKSRLVCLDILVAVYSLRCLAPLPLVRVLIKKSDERRNTGSSWDVPLQMRAVYAYTRRAEAPSYPSHLPRPSSTSSNLVL